MQQTQISRATKFNNKGLFFNFFFLSYIITLRHLFIYMNHLYQYLYLFIALFIFWRIYSTCIFKCCTQRSLLYCSLQQFLKDFLFMCLLLNACVKNTWFWKKPLNIELNLFINTFHDLTIPLDRCIFIHYLPISNWTLSTTHFLLNIYKNTGRIILKLQGCKDSVIFHIVWL